MRPFRSTIPLDEALAILLEAARPVERTETVPLEQAAGRVLATVAVATRDVPPFDRSAMDGYALRAADTHSATPGSPVPLDNIGTTFAGEAPAARVGPGQCCTISTGAPLPEGADAVVMVEHTAQGPGAKVQVLSEVVQGQNVGRRGADITTGATVVPAGAVLTPARLGALAALGLALVEVHVQPLVYLASTGNELVPPGQPLGAGQIYEINRFTLAPVVAAHGGIPRVGPVALDTLESLADALDRAEAAGADLIVLSGGSSVGDRDLLVDAVRARGEVLFHGIAVKPGKPTLLARLGSRLLLGMPGNPTSCLSNAYILLIPLLRRLARLPPWTPRRQRLPLARAVPNASGRHTFFTVRIESGQAVPAFKGSGDITSLAHADGYIEIPAEVTDLPAGALVDVTELT